MKSLLSWHIRLFFLLVLSYFTNTTAKRPNILLILTDDMGNADASFNFRITNADKIKNNESPPILTPHLDYLAESGIIFKNHYTNMICGPSRSALLSSRFAYKIGNPFAYKTKGHLLPKFKTFAHELLARGYRNHFIGKYGIDQQGRFHDEINDRYIPQPTHNDALGPLSRGFNTFYGLYNSAHNHFTKSVLGLATDWHKFNETHLLEAPYTLDSEIHLSSTHIFTRETINAIKQDTNNNQPWFIHLSFTMPHDPMQVDAKYIDDFEHCNKIQGWRRRIYCGMVTCVDEGIGNITSYLKQNGLLKDTVIIFSADNGGFPNVGGFNYPLRGMKISPYEGGVKTISFIYGPKVFTETSGMIFEGNIHLVDWGPTLLSIVDTAMNKQESVHNIMGNDIDGEDYMETLKHFNDKSNENLLSRKEWVIEARWWNNLTVYRYNEYKLFLGSILYDQLFMEPNDKYALNSNDRKQYQNYDWIVTDYFNYFIANIFGPNWFWFEWNASVLGRILYKDLVLNRNNDCPKSELPSLDKRPPNNQTFHWPFITNWDPECNAVRLYNLETDPTESNNLAYNDDHTEIVIEILNKLRTKLKNEYESNQLADDRSADGLMDFVTETQVKIRRIFLMLILILCGSMFICCCGVYRCCCKTTSKEKSKKD